MLEFSLTWMLCQVTEAVVGPQLSVSGDLCMNGQVPSGLAVGDGSPTCVSRWVSISTSVAVPGLIIQSFYSDCVSLYFCNHL